MCLLHGLFQRVRNTLFFSHIFLAQFCSTNVIFSLLKSFLLRDLCLPSQLIIFPLLLPPLFSIFFSIFYYPLFFHFFSICFSFFFHLLFTLNTSTGADWSTFVWKGCKKQKFGDTLSTVTPPTAEVSNISTQVVKKSQVTSVVEPFLIKHPVAGPFIGRIAPCVPVCGVCPSNTHLVMACGPTHPQVSSKGFPRRKYFCALLFAVRGPL
jgi:hypothetical protein